LVWFGGGVCKKGLGGFGVFLGVQKKVEVWVGWGGCCGCWGGKGLRNEFTDRGRRSSGTKKTNEINRSHSRKGSMGVGKNEKGVGGGGGVFGFFLRSSGGGKRKLARRRGRGERNTGRVRNQSPYTRRKPGREKRNSGAKKKVTQRRKLERYVEGRKR